MYRYKALVMEVIDAENIKAAVDLGFGIVTNQKVKLAGIDGSEFKDPNNCSKAEKAKKFIEEALLHKEVTIKSLKAEKSGRYLSFVYLNDDTKSFNDLMVEQGIIAGYKKRDTRVSK